MGSVSVNDSYDDWFDENAPCSTSSSPPSRLPCLATLRNACPPVAWLWTLTWIGLAFLGLVLGSASGCASRTIFVPEESPMRVGPQSRIYVYHRIDGTWTLSQNRIEIPEGWYMVPPSYVSQNADQ